VHLGARCLCVVCARCLRLDGADGAEQTEQRETQRPRDPETQRPRDICLAHRVSCDRDRAMPYSAHRARPSLPRSDLLLVLGPTLACHHHHINTSELYSFGPDAPSRTLPILSTFIHRQHGQLLFVVLYGGVCLSAFGQPRPSSSSFAATRRGEPGTPWCGSSLVND
jgi:hypothetical protein